MPHDPETSIWVEKYRPRSLADMVGQDSVVPLLRAYAAKRTMPHLLFTGSPGTGKTTAALALCRDLFGESWRENFLELNASNERGIETVRTKIKDYARIMPLGDVGFKVLFLDEADNLTPEAQASLRRMMESYSASTRFILSCNYSSRVIEPIQSRCAVFRFKSLSEVAVRQHLERIAKAEKSHLGPGAIEAIMEFAEGDLRRAVNLLQLAATYADPVTEATIRDVAGAPVQEDVAAMVHAAVQGDFLGARSRLLKLLTDRGAGGEDILRAIHRELPSIPDAEISPREKMRILEYLGEIDFRLTEGASERLQLETLLARLALARNPAG